jgi:hypothetical protein
LVCASSKVNAHHVISGRCSHTQRLDVRLLIRQRFDHFKSLPDGER